MVVTDIKHVEQQVQLTDALKKGIDFLKRPDIQLLADGRIDIDGDRVFAIAQRYDTVATDAPRFECHRKYIDIQYIVTGSEVIGWTPAELMEITEEYDINKDICFGTAKGDKYSSVYLKEDQLAVLYPEDGHAPKIAYGRPSSVFKIVIKVAVN